MTILPKKKVQKTDKKDAREPTDRVTHHNRHHSRSSQDTTSNRWPSVPVDGISPNSSLGAFNDHHQYAGSLTFPISARPILVSNTSTNEARLHRKRNRQQFESGSKHLPPSARTIARSGPKRPEYLSGGGTKKGASKPEASFVSNLPSEATASSEAEACNSEDEHDEKPLTEDATNREAAFEAELKTKKGFIIKKMETDGACLFRAFADQIYGGQDFHELIRKHCIDYMSKNADYFSPYVTEDFRSYLQRKSRLDCHGNHLEIQALCEIYNRPVEIYQYSIDPINTFTCINKTENPPVRLSYHFNCHYNSVIDPYNPSVAVGLGMPNLQPGLADRNLMRDAANTSERAFLERTMLDDKLRETDWEVTEEALQEQVARESYLQYLRDHEKRLREESLENYGEANASSSTVGSGTVISSELVAPEATTVSLALPPEESLLAEATSALVARSPIGLSLSPSLSTTGLLTPTINATSLIGSRSPNQLSPSPRATSRSPVNQAGSAHRISATVSPTPIGAACTSNTQPAVGFPETASLRDHLPPILGLCDWIADEETEVLERVLAQSQCEYYSQLKQKHANGSTCTSNSDSASNQNLAQPTTTEDSLCVAQDSQNLPETGDSGCDNLLSASKNTDESPT